MAPLTKNFLLFCGLMAVVFQSVLPGAFAAASDLTPPNAVLLILDDAPSLDHADRIDAARTSITPVPESPLASISGESEKTITRVHIRRLLSNDSPRGPPAL